MTPLTPTFISFGAIGTQLDVNQSIDAKFHEPTQREYRNLGLNLGDQEFVYGVAAGIQYSSAPVVIEIDGEEFTVGVPTDLEDLVILLNDLDIAWFYLDSYDNIVARAFHDMGDIIQIGDPVFSVTDSQDLTNRPTQTDINRELALRIVNQQAGIGTVTSVQASDLNPLFTTDVNYPDSTPYIIFQAIKQSVHKVYASPLSGVDDYPTFRTFNFYELADTFTYPGNAFAFPMVNSAMTALIPAQILGSNVIAVKVASTVALTVTYNNGASGVGATITLTAGTLNTMDGITLSDGDRFLYKNASVANQLQNGVYIRNSSTLATRTTDADTTAELDPEVVIPTQGTQQNIPFTQQTDTPVIGSDDIVYDQLPAGKKNSWLYNGNTVPAIKWIGTKNNIDFPIRTNGIERARVFATGEVGVGITATPLAKFHVRGTTADSSASSFYAENSTSTHLLQYRNDGWILRGSETGVIAKYSVPYIGTGNGADNTSWGFNALNALTNGQSNTAIGTNAGAGITTQNGNTLVGSGSLASGTRIELTAMGLSSTGADYSVAIGSGAQAGTATGSQYYNIAIGYSATTGAGFSRIALGAVAANNADNQMVIGSVLSNVNHNLQYWSASGIHGTYFRTSTPEGAQAAQRGSIAYVDDGATGTVYVKQTLTTSSGWAALLTSGASGTIPVGTTGQTLYYAANGNVVTATSNLFNDGTNVGIGGTPTVLFEAFNGADSVLQLDPSGNTFYVSLTQQSNFGKRLLLDASNRAYKFGDVDGVNNGTVIFVDDASANKRITYTATNGHQLSGSVGINTSPTANALEVLGDTVITGKLTVTGAIDPTHLYLDEQSGDPSPVANKGILYVKEDVYTESELFYMNSAGAAYQVATSAYRLSDFAATTSLQLKGVISDETGSGALVFATTPTFITPVLGAATATSINKVTITAPASSATLTIADGKTLTISNSITMVGTDSTTMTFPTTTATIARTDAGQTFTGNQLCLGAATVSTSSLVFRTTNGGSNVTATFVVDTGSVTAGNAYIVDSTINAFGFTRANGTRRIVRCAIGLVNPTDTAGSETGDLGFYTKVAASAIAEVVRITSIGDVKLLTVGGGIYVKEGTNGTSGVATLVGGTVTVSTTKVTANSRIYLSVQSLGTVAVATPIAVTARSAGTSFTITSSGITDTSVVAWLIIEPS